MHAEEAARLLTLIADDGLEAGALRRALTLAIHGLVDAPQCNDVDRCATEALRGIALVLDAHAAEHVRHVA